MRGIVLAAGGGTRLRPLTDELPKTLLAVDGERTILELAIANLASCGITDILVVSGHAASEIDAAVVTYEQRYGVAVEVRFNERYATANNAYSLWLTRDAWGDGALMVNGDTVHPVSVEQALLAARGSGDLLLAVDQDKPLAEEEMKVELDQHHRLLRISKGLSASTSDGEYIGVALIEAAATAELARSLEQTFAEDANRWYEDGFQVYVDAGGSATAVDIGRIAWVEVDDHADLAAARSL